MKTHLTRVIVLVGWCLGWLTPPRTAGRSRGLSQSTENAILLAGAVAVAALIIKVITDFVQGRLPH